MSPSRIALDDPAPSLDTADNTCSAPEELIPLGPDKVPVILGHPAPTLIGDAEYH